MPALAAIDEAHAWLLRGLIEGGVADGTGRSLPPTGAGVLDGSDLLRLGRGNDGIRLTFMPGAGLPDTPGAPALPVAPEPGSLEDGYVYQIKPVRQGVKVCTAVRCVDTLYYKEFEEAPLDSLGARVLADIRAHNAGWDAWRQRGGRVSYAERAGVPDVPGAPCSAALSNFLERHWRSGGRLEEGPEAGWWIARHESRRMGRQIGLGKGEEAYVVKATPAEAELPENRQWLARVRWAGAGLAGAGGLSFVWCMGMVGYLLYRWWTMGFNSVFSAGWPLASLILNGAVGVAQVWAGLQIRQLESAFSAQLVAIVSFIPCWGPCCLPAAIPAAATLWLMRDERTEQLFQS